MRLQPLQMNVIVYYIRRPLLSGHPILKHISFTDPIQPLCGVQSDRFHRFDWKIDTDLAGWSYIYVLLMCVPWRRKSYKLKGTLNSLLHQSLGYRLFSSDQTELIPLSLQISRQFKHQQKNIGTHSTPADAASVCQLTPLLFNCFERFILRV